MKWECLLLFILLNNSGCATKEIYISDIRAEKTTPLLKRQIHITLDNKLCPNWDKIDLGIYQLLGNMLAAEKVSSRSFELSNKNKEIVVNFEHIESKGDGFAICRDADYVIETNECFTEGGSLNDTVIRLRECHKQNKMPTEYEEVMECIE